MAERRGNREKHREREKGDDAVIAYLSATLIDCNFARGPLPYIDLLRIWLIILAITVNFV